MCVGGGMTRKFGKEKKAPKTIKKAARGHRGLAWHWRGGKVEEIRLRSTNEITKGNCLRWESHWFV